MLSPRRRLLLLALVSPACGDSATQDPETTGLPATSAATSTGDTTGLPASTGAVPTTSAGSAEATDSTSEPLTSGPDTTTTTGDPETSSSTSSTSTTSTTTTDPSTSSTTDTTGAPPCGPGSPGPDADGDSVPDACDACPAGDDLIDADADGAADACDPCPADVPDDSDGDGVCEGVDVCQGGDDNVDGDGDGVPDFCDDEVLLMFPQPIDDHDVAGDGALVVVRATGGQVFATCFNGDRSVRRPEFVAGTYDPMNDLPAHPTIHIARASQQVLVTWYDRNGGDANHRIAYSYLDDACQPLVTTQTAIAVPAGYMEFHDAAIDEVGRAAVSVSPDATFFNRISAAGVAQVQEQIFDINAVYGTHVAVNQATGDGIVAAQVHSGNGIYYRRFTAAGAWLDPGPVMMPVGYHYWYDGFTVGMNDAGEFVFLWRSDGTALDMRFHAANGQPLASVTRVTIDFEGWDGGHCYDSFRRRHQEIPLRGDDFILGEVYNWITPQANRVVHHFAYTPDGTKLAEQQTTHNMDEGLTIRLDEIGSAYLRDDQGIHILADYP